MKSFRRAALCGALIWMAAVPASDAQPAPAAVIRNIVLVDGAFADGAGWRAVYDRLSRDGYTVRVVVQSHQSLAGDALAARKIIDQMTGPVVLVGHSHGGTVITEAGTDPKVTTLVYIAAHAPDVGETEEAQSQRYPFLAHKPIKADGLVRIDPDHYREDFAADLPKLQTDFQVQLQVPTPATIFETPVAHAAWKDKPSWYLVAQSDHIIHPDLERMYARRAHAHTIEARGASHSVHVSQPGLVAALIEDAANGDVTLTRAKAAQ